MQQCNTYIYIVINVVHNQSPRRIPNSAHIPGFREAILVFVHLCVFVFVCVRLYVCLRVCVFVCVCVFV